MNKNQIMTEEFYQVFKRLMLINDIKLALEDPAFLDSLSTGTLTDLSRLLFGHEDDVHEHI